MTWEAGTIHDTGGNKGRREAENTILRLDSNSVSGSCLFTFFANIYDDFIIIAVSQDRQKQSIGLSHFPIIILGKTVSYVDHMTQ